jgi:hypothetical protein
MNGSEIQHPTSAGIPDPNPQVRHANRRRIVASRLSSKLGACAASAIWCVALLLAQKSTAQSYSISWYKIAGGGGTSTGGTYSVSGTIGQHDAGGTLNGGNYSVTGGFWSLIGVVQTPGVPNLTITHSGNSVIVSWPDTGAYTLLQNTNLAGGTWTTNSATVSTSNGISSITITPPTGRLFLRLRSP